MIAIGEPTDDSLRNCFLVEIDMTKRRRIVITAVIKIDPPALQSRAEIRHRLNILARPATLAHKRGGDEKDAARRQVRRLFGENIDENGCAARMTHQNGVVSEFRELFLKGRLPERVFRIGFIWHARIANFIIQAEFSLKTTDEFVVPFVMHTFAAALNE